MTSAKKDARPRCSQRYSLKRHHVVYILREDLREPLIKSQVVSYLNRMKADICFSIIQLAKNERDFAVVEGLDSPDLEGIRQSNGRFRRGYKGGAGIGNVFDLIRLTLRETREGDVALLHARSYSPAMAAWVVSRLRGVPYVFDMRALWLEELIVGGKLRRNSIPHRLLEAVERRLLRDAAGIVSLTEAAVEHLQARYPKELAAKHITVIPTCADLDRFKPPETHPEASVYGCVGTVLSGWFKTDWLAAFFRAVARHDPKARFEVVTRDDAEPVQRQIDPDGALDALSVFSAKPEQVHRDFQRQTASAMFFTEGIGKLGSAPTRLGEVLGCGIPVVANEGVGDVARILRRYRVGVIARDCTDNAMDEAVRNLTELRKDPSLPARCRQAAEKVFSLAKGTEAYRSLYAEILGESDASAPSDAEDAG